MGATPLRKGDRCVHLPSDEAEVSDGVPGEVVAVHWDDGEPYFTVQLHGGGERETVASHQPEAQDLRAHS